MHQRLSSTEHMRLRSVLRKPGFSKKQKGRGVTFNESLNLFYEAECSCWIHEDEYSRMRQEEHERREREEIFKYEPPPVEFEDPPTLSPPEGYKDRFFPQEAPNDPDVTRVSPPSPPAARRKVFLRENPIINGQEEDDDGDELRKSKTSRLGGILKGGRLWRSNSAEGKKVTTSPDEPDVVKCAEHSSSNCDTAPVKVSTGTAPLRTSEQIRLAVDSTLRSRTKKKPECSSLVEKLRWLTSLDDEDSSDSNASGFATWPSRDKNGTMTKSNKSDAGTSTNEEFVQSATMRHPPINSASEAKIRQISYTLEDIDEGLKTGENELESFITEDGERIDRIRKRYGEDVGGDDYGFSRRPSVKGIKPKFSTSNQIFAQFSMKTSPMPSRTPETAYENTRLPDVEASLEAQQQASMANALDNARINYEFANAPGRQTEETRAHFEMIRQSCEPVAYGTFSRPHSWSGTNNCLPGAEGVGPAGNQSDVPKLSNQSMQQPPKSVQPPPMMGPAQNPSGHLPPQVYPMNQMNQNLYGTLPHPSANHNNSMYGPLSGAHLMQHQGVYGNIANNCKPPIYSGQSSLPMNMSNIPGQQQHQQQQQQQQQQMYGTVRRVPNVIGRPLFLHYGALSVEAHPNKIIYPKNKVPETPSPTQQPPPIRYYGPPIRYYNPPPPVPPRTAASSLSSAANNPAGLNGGDSCSNQNLIPFGGQNVTSAPSEHERGVPEGATDEEPVAKEPYSMNV